jgi:hypothetical protein
MFTPLNSLSMKIAPFLFIPVLLIFLVSCGGDPASESTGNAAANEADTTFRGRFRYDTLKGLYTGEIGDSPITLNISFASEMHATGYNVVKGNRRNISGRIGLSSKGADLVLSEPGDDKYDGVFRLTMPHRDLSVLTGEWESPSGEVKAVKLKRKVYPEGDEEDSFFTYTRIFSDSLGTLYFNDDGTARYEYYLNQGTEKEQLKIVKGSWSAQGMKATVFWQQNPIFTEKKTVFDIANSGELIYEDENDPSGNVYEHKIEWRGRTLWEDITG